MVHGDMEIWKYGDIKTWGRGYGDIDTEDIDMGMQRFGCYKKKMFCKNSTKVI
jgi:hypothetical protein